MSSVDVEGAVRRICGASMFICFTGKNCIPGKISFTVRRKLFVCKPMIFIAAQVSSDRRMLEFKKGKSVVTEQIDFASLEMTFERIEGFPKDSNPAHVSEATNALNKTPCLQYL